VTATKDMKATLGSLLRDRRRDRIGVVTALRAEQVHLRPLGGGIAWTARPEELEKASKQDELRARVRELNVHSSDRRYW
jgi:hypothetical protein